MKNCYSAVLALSLIATASLGCSSINPFSGSKETHPSSTEPVVRNSTYKSTGVQECDEVSDLIEAELNNSDDNFVVKAAKATVLNRIKDGIRESAEKNKGDTVELAKTCREFKAQFEKYKAEEESKKKK